jgi:hypothetical protein
MNIQTATSFQYRLHVEHKARQARFAAAAAKVAPKPILALVNPVEPEEPPPAPKVNGVLLHDHNDHVIAYRCWQAGVERKTARSMEEIARDVLALYPGVTLKQIHSPSRVRIIVIPLHHVVYAIRQERPDISYPSIGRWMGSRDHTTILAIRI